MSREKLYYPPKITQPLSRNVLARERLFQRLDEARSQATIVWVSAPGGSGKTTLVSSYLQSRKVNSIWYQVDEGDAELATFFHYLGLGGKKASPRRKTQLPALTPEYLPGLTTFTRRFFEELAVRLHKGGVLVLDNFQLLDENGPLAQLLEVMAAAVAGQLTLLVVSRSQIPARLSGLQVKRELLEVTADEVRFTEQEWLAVAKYLNVSATAVQLSGLYQQMEGWIAGLVLCDGEVPATLHGNNIVHETNEPLFNYFAHEFFNRLGETTRNLLLHCSLLNHFSEGEARILSGVEVTASILQGLEKKNVFIQGRGNGFYTLHPLFRAYLQHEARQRLGSGTFQQLAQQSAGLLSAQGEVEAAAELYIQMQHWDALVQLIVARADGLYEQGRMDTLQNWLQALPENHRQQHTDLLYWEAALLGFRDVAACLDKLAQVFDRYLAEEHELGAWRSWLLAVDLMNKTWMESNRYQHWLPRHKECREHFAGTIPAELENQLLANLAMGYMMSGHDPVATEYWLEQLDHAVRRCVHKPSLALLLCSGLFTCMVLGYLTRAKRYLAMLNEMQGVEQMGPLMHLHILATRMMGDSFAGDPRRSQGLYQQGQTLEEESGVTIFEGIFQIAGIMSALTVGDPVQAHKHLDMLERVKDQAVMNTINFVWGKTHLALYERRFELAVEYAGVAEQMTREVGIPTYSLLTKLFLIEACREVGDSHRARLLLDEADREAERLHMPLGQIRVHLLKARFAMDEGSEEEVRQQLSSLFAIAGKYDMQTYPGWVPARLISWGFHTALQWNIATDVVCSLARQLILWLRPPGPDLISWPWPVRIRSFGGFTLELDGGTALGAGKQDKRPLQLLQLLVMRGGAAGNREIMDTLYSDYDEEKAQALLRKHLYRLRALLGFDETIERQGSGLKLNRKLCWIDSEAFDALLQQNRAESRLQAIELYRGTYLEQVADDDIQLLAHREKLRGDFLRAALENLTELEGEEAIAWCHQVLHTEPYAEVIYQQLLELYRAGGRPDLVRATYEQCRRTLLAGLGVEPMEATREAAGLA